MNVLSTDGQLSIDDMDVAPIRIGGGQETLEKKIERSYRALRLASEMSHEYYGEPVIVTYSGGKDSDVILRLAEECLGTDFEVLNSHTTVDAPQTVRHIEKTFKRLEEKGIKTIYRNRFPVENTMWDLIVKKKFPPTRKVRYCCSVLKETGTKNRIAVLGVRAAEGVKRRGREVFGIKGVEEWSFFSLDHAEEVHRESKEINDPAWDCTLIQKAKAHDNLTVNAIYEWEDGDVWDFIKDRDIDVNPLYGMGLPRVACVLCPLSGIEEKKKECAMFPTYKQAYIRAFDKMLEQDGFFATKKKRNWKTGEEVFDWWTGIEHENIEGQMSMFDEQEEEEDDEG